MGIELKGVCTVDEAKDILGLSYQSTINLILDKKIKAKKFGWGWVIEVKSVKRYARKKTRLEGLKNKSSN